MVNRIMGGGSSQPYIPSWSVTTQPVKTQSPVTTALKNVASKTWGNDPYATTKNTQTKPAKPTTTASGTKAVTPITPAYHGAQMNNGGMDLTNAGQPSGPVHSIQPSPSQIVPYQPQSTWNPRPSTPVVVQHPTGTGYSTPPVNTSVVPPTGGSGAVSTKPPTNTNVPPSGTNTGGTTPPATGNSTPPSTGTGTGSSGASTPPFESGSGTYNPSGVNQLASDALGSLNTSADQSQWQTMAQQQAAASYIQQETAWQTYINQLMSQMGLTDKGYQDQLNNSLNTLNDKSFQDYLQGRQDMADRGLANSGLASAQNTQLALAQQQQIGQLQQQMNQQKYANDTNYGQQMNQVNSQMDTLDPQALYDQYYQTIQQSGQQAAQQQFNDYMQMLQQYGPYLSPTADQYGQLSNTYNKNLQDYLLGQQNANTNQFTAQADANYKAGQLGVAQGQLALKASDTAVQEQQKWAQIANQQQSLDTQAAHYAAQDANSARSTTALQITKAMDNLTTQMDNALTNNKPDQYNQLYAQWQGLQQSLQNVTMGAVGGSSGN